MAKKQLSYAARQAIAQQAMQNLNRKAAASVKSGNDEFWNPTRPGQATWNECQREAREAEEQKLAPIKAAQDKLNKTFLAAQANELMTIPNDPYLQECCKQTEKPNTDDGIRSAFIAFRDILLPTTITDAGVELLGRITDLNPRIDWSSTSPLTFHTVWSRLMSLGLAKEKTHFISNNVAVKQSTPDQEPIDARDAAEAQWFTMFQETWDAWLQSMADGWDFHPTLEQRRAALNLLMKLGMGDGIWDECRRRLVSSGVFPANLRTIDDVLTARLEAGAFGDLNTPAGKAAYARERTQLVHGHSVEY